MLGEKVSDYQYEDNVNVVFYLELYLRKLTTF